MKAVQHQGKFGLGPMCIIHHDSAHVQWYHGEIGDLQWFFCCRIDAIDAVCGVQVREVGLDNTWSKRLMRGCWLLVITQMLSFGAGTNP